MTSLEAALRQIHADLIDSCVSFALVGGLAVSARTEPRFTRDADLAVALADDAEAEALIHNLRNRGYGIGAVVEQDAVGRLATVRLTRSSEVQAPVIDLLFASSGIETEVVAEAEPIELLPNLTIGVARTGHLIALKILSRDDVSRPQDIVDLRALLRVASSAELARARVARADRRSRISQRPRSHVGDEHLPLCALTLASHGFHRVRMVSCARAQARRTAPLWPSCPRSPRRASRT